MLTLIVLFTIVLIAVFGYFTNEINKRNNSISAWRDSAYAWETYAISLESKLYNIQTRYDLTAITEYKIDKGIIPAHVVSDNGHKTYAMELPGMPAIPSDYTVKLESDGKIEVIRPVANPDVKESEAKESKTSKPKDSAKNNGSKKQTKENKAKDNSKASASDTGMFSSTNGNMFTSAKYGEFIDYLTDSLNMKRGSKLPTAKYNYAKDMYKKWESGKNPNTATEYAKRIINAKFGGK